MGRRRALALEQSAGSGKAHGDTVLFYLRTPSCVCTEGSVSKLILTRFGGRVGGPDFLQMIKALEVRLAAFSFETS